MIFRFFVSVWLVIFSGWHSFANDAPFYVNEKHPNFLILNGMIDGRSAIAFDRVVSSKGPFDAIILNSPGGSVQNALLIAKDVRRAGMNTYIAKEHECASACAYIFLAGLSRIADGKLGVHQIYGEEENGRDTQIYIADIIEFLSDFDVDTNIFIKMLRTPPDKMYYFSDQEKLNLKINRDRATEVARKETTEPENRTIRKVENDPADELLSPGLEKGIMTGEQLKTAIINFISLHESKDGTNNLREINRIYADYIDYFDKVTPRAELWEDKFNYFKRWPVRKYNIDKRRITAICGVNQCKISGTYRYDLASPSNNRKTRGQAMFLFEVQNQYPYLIVAEGGKVLERGGAKKKQLKKSNRKLFDFLKRQRR